MHSYSNLPRSEVPIKVRSRKGSSSKSIRVSMLSVLLIQSVC
jgi:hypothetical protein